MPFPIPAFLTQKLERSEIIHPCLTSSMCDNGTQLNFLRFRDGDRTVSLGGKNTVKVTAGDRLTILTPGGGGHGTPPATAAAADDATARGRDASMDVDEESDQIEGDWEDPDRKSRRKAEMRLSGSVAGHRMGQEQA